MVSASLVICLNNDNLILYTQRIKHFIWKLETFAIASHNRSLKFETDSRFWKHVSIFTSFIIVCYSVAPFIFVPSALLLKLDPSYILLKDFIRNVWLLNLARLAVCSICVAEAYRFISFYFTYFVYIVECYYAMLQALNEITPSNILKTQLNLIYVEHQHRVFLKWYTGLQLLHESFVSTLSLLISFLMATGFAIFVECNTGTLTWYGGELPLSMYYILPLGSFICFILSYLLLSVAIQLAKDFECILTRERKQFEVLTRITLRLTFEKNYLGKVYKSRRPIAFSCGPFYQLKTGTDLDFFHHVLVRTVDVILLERIYI